MNKTAILLFIRTVRDEGRVKKLFGNNQTKNLAFFQALNDKARRVVKATNLPYYVCTSDLQEGDTFVDRYENAIKSVFDKGYENVITIGNDSPEITSKILLDIASKLHSYNLVYGSTKNNGICTLGLSKKGFHSFDFKEMSWQTDRLITDFELYHEVHGDVLKLDFNFAEFNSVTDIRDFLIRIHNNIQDKVLYGKIFQLYFDRRVPKKKQVIDVQKFFSSEIESRGPPFGLVFAS